MGSRRPARRGGRAREACRSAAPCVARPQAPCAAAVPARGAPPAPWRAARPRSRARHARRAARPRSRPQRAVARAARPSPDRGGRAVAVARGLPPRRLLAPRRRRAARRFGGRRSRGSRDRPPSSKAFPVAPITIAIGSNASSSAPLWASAFPSIPARESSKRVPAST